MLNNYHNRSNSRKAVTILALLLFIVPSARAQRAARPVEDSNGQALEKFYRALTATLVSSHSGTQEITRIVHYGDSHIAADILTASLRNSFQRNFGSGGAGFIQAGKPWPWYSRKGVATGATAGWRVLGLGESSQAGSWGLAGVALSSSTAGEKIWLSATGQRFDLYLLKQPGGGRCDVFFDGLRYFENVSLAAEEREPFYLTISAAGSEPHSIELRTLDKGEVRLFGITVESDSAGVTYDALGINGARAYRPHNWDWALIEDHLARRAPHLIIISYGANEVSDADLDLREYRDKLVELINKFQQAAPQASILVVSPPDRAIRAGGRWRSIDRMAQLVQVQRDAARRAGAAFWDQYQAMGGNGAIARWARLNPPLAQRDRVHLTATGYNLIAERFYGELMRGYTRWLWQEIFFHHRDTEIQRGR